MSHTRRVVPTLPVLVLVFGVGCAGAGASDAGSGPPATAIEAPTADGRFLVRVEPSPEAFPFNELFELDVTVLSAAEPKAPVPEAEVFVQAWMPEHGHGMNTFPRVEPAGRGLLRVSGMLLHMHGYWELSVNVVHEGTATFARFEVNLE